MADPREEIKQEEDQGWWGRAWDRVFGDDEDEAPEKNEAEPTSDNDPGIIDTIMDPMFWDEVGNSAEDLVEDVADIAEGTAAIVVNTYNYYADEENPDWVDTRMDIIVNSDLAVNGGINDAAKWIDETALPAIGDGALWTVDKVAYLGAEILYIPYAVEDELGVNILPRGQEIDNDYIRTVMQDVSRRHQSVLNYENWWATDTARAAALTTQGITNGIYDTAGLIVNVVDGIGTSIYNLGATDEEYVEIGLTTFIGGEVMESFHENAQIKDWRILPDSWRDEFGAIQHKLVDPNNPTKTIENPNLEYEQTTLYGSQALTEVGTFFVGGAGIVSAANATIKTTKATTGALKATVKPVDLAEKQLKATEKLIEKEAKLAEASANTAKAEEKLAQATKGKDPAKAEATSTEPQISKRAAKKEFKQAKNAEESAKEGVEKAEKEVVKAEEKLDRAAKDKVIMADASAPAKAAHALKRTAQDIASEAKDGLTSGAKTGFKVMNPLESPGAAAAETGGVMLTMGLGIHFDNKAAEQRLKSAKNINEGNIKQHGEKTEQQIEFDKKAEEELFNDPLPDTPKKSGQTPEIKGGTPSSSTTVPNLNSAFSETVPNHSAPSANDRFYDSKITSIEFNNRAPQNPLVTELKQPISYTANGAYLNISRDMFPS